MQLSKFEKDFEKLGIKAVSMTYDKNADIVKFAKKEGIKFPLLSDVDAQHVIRFGILNKDYEPGHRAYGIPYPGIFLVDDKGIIVEKFAEEGYRARPPWDMILERAKSMANR
ncbi:MAG: peroxiredoxin [Flavobacterium sp.]